MYGATEATARMAYLPPHLTVERPESIGVPIPGGTFRIDGDDEVGELVYSGPNVMLGYASSPQDLALGRTVHELRTGDLARQHEDGLFELVGRTSRFAKLFGLRIDLDRVEHLSAQGGCPARAVEHGGRLHLFVTSHRDQAQARLVAAGDSDSRTTPWPSTCCRTSPSRPTASPTTAPSAGTPRRRRETSRAEHDGPVTASQIRDLYAHLLGRPDADEDDSFVSLRGDSLSYVEASVRLGRLLPDLPKDWAQLPARRLAAGARHSPGAGRRSWAPVETSVVVRAVAIVLIVASHANLMTVMGGAHVLLAVVGFNIAQFQLSRRPRSERRNGLFHAARRVAVPSALWIAGAAVVTGMYDASTALMLNNVLGSDTWDVRWQFWFLEVVVWALLAASLLVCVPAADRFERAHPFGAATTVFVATLVTRYALVGVEAGPTERYALPVVLWCVGLGWMAARSETFRQQVITSVAAVLACWGYFGDPVREGLVAAGVCVLVWLPRLRAPAVLLPLLQVLAASSLFVYLTHWQVYPHLEMDHPLWATLASFAVGVLVLAGPRARRGVRHKGLAPKASPAPRSTNRTGHSRRTTGETAAA